MAVVEASYDSDVIVVVVVIVMVMVVIVVEMVVVMLTYMMMTVVIRCWGDRRGRGYIVGKAEYWKGNGDPTFFLHHITG